MICIIALVTRYYSYCIKSQNYKRKKEAPKGPVRFLHSTAVQSHPSYTPRKEVGKGSKSRRYLTKEANP